MANNVKEATLSQLHFKEGYTPFTYLGVLIITYKLSFNDCKPLVDKILMTIKSQKSNFLSYASRLMFIKSILFSIQIFQASIFLLPSKVIKEINGNLKAFFWVGVSFNKRKPIVAWKDICLPKEKGRYSKLDQNKIAMAKHIWNICDKSSSSLWVDWVKAFRYKGKSLWEINASENCS